MKPSSVVAAEILVRALDRKVVRAVKAEHDVLGRKGAGLVLARKSTGAPVDIEMSHVVGAVDAVRLTPAIYGHPGRLQENYTAHFRYGPLIALLNVMTLDELMA